MKRKTVALLVFTGAIAVAGAAQAQQPPTAADLQGAWVEQGASCTDVFEARNGRLAFRRPVDAFAPAFIVSGKTLRTPLANCKYVHGTVGKDRANIVLSCTNSISTDSVKLILTLKAPGVLIRQLGDETDMRAGSAYQLCKP